MPQDVSVCPEFLVSGPFFVFPCRPQTALTVSVTSNNSLGTISAMVSLRLLVGCLFTGTVLAQSSGIESDTRSILTLSGTVATTPTGSYQSQAGQVTRSSSGGLVNQNGASTTSATNGTAASTTQAPGTTSLVTLLLGGGVGQQTLSVINGTTTVYPNTTASATRTSTGSRPTNTQACNNYPEFCNRKYSNITEVCAHNSAFVRPGNAGSNQQLGVTQQLDDGIRMSTSPQTYRLKCKADMTQSKVKRTM